MTVVSHFYSSRLKGTNDLIPPQNLEESKKQKKNSQKDKDPHYNYAVDWLFAPIQINKLVRIALYSYT